MSVQSHPSHNTPIGTLSYLDGVATAAHDIWLLIGRVLVCWLFLAIGLDHVANTSGFAGYLASLNTPLPGLMAWLGGIAEVVIGLTLLFGFATRYGAALGIVFLIIATALAHRYWQYPPARVGAEYSNFLKNLSIMGGLFYVFVYGAGRYSIDHMIGRR